MLRIPALLALQTPWIPLLWVTLVVYATVEIWRDIHELDFIRFDLPDDRRSTAPVTALAFGGPMLGIAASGVAGWQMLGDNSIGLFLVGLVLTWSGIAFRWWAVRTLGRFFRSGVIVQAGHQVVTTGPYRLVRHPAYAGTLLASVGIGVALGNWLSLALCLLLPLAGYLWRIGIEEEALTRKLPEYSAYAARTKRLIPYIW